MTMRHPSRRLVLSLRLFGALFLLLLPLFLAVPPHLRQDALIGPLGDRYHVGLFAVLTVLLHRHGPLRGRPLVVIAVCLALGGATEVLQQLAGRSAAFWDWYQDALGVGLGACWIWWRGTGRRLGPLVAAAAIVGLVLWPLRGLPVTVRESRAASARFPLLDDFERPHSLALWSGHQGAAIARVPVAGRGQVLQMTSDDDTQWPGIKSAQLPWDWTGRHTLRVDCRLRDPSPATMRLSIWIEDRAGRYDSDYIAVGFDVDHQWHTYEVSLEDTPTRRQGRRLALGEIRALAVFVTRKDGGAVALQVDDLRLDDPAPDDGKLDGG